MAALVAAARTILNAYNPIEEGPVGVYEQCDNLAGVEAEQTLLQARSAPEVTVSPHMDAAKV